MSFSISTLLIRNLHDVFGENDPAHQRTAINEILTEECVFYEPIGRPPWPRRDRSSRARSRRLRLTFAIADCRARGIGQWRSHPMGIGPPW